MTTLRLLLASLLLFSTAISVPAWAREYQSHRFADQRLSIDTDDGTYQLRFLSADAVEVSFSKPGMPPAHSYSLQDPSAGLSGYLNDTPTQISFEQRNIQVLIEKSPLRIHYRSHGRDLISESTGFSWDTEQGIALEFALSEAEKLLGGGERMLGMDRRGHRLPLYNKPDNNGKDQMNFSIPGFLSNRHYMLMFDNAAKGWMDLGATQADTLRFEAVGGRAAYYVVAGETYPQILENFTALAGRQPMLPRWAYGYFASRFGYHNEAQVREVLAKFAEYNLPVDAVVLDLYWFGKDIQGHMGNLAWDLEAWPQPKQMLADFKQQGVNTVLISEPYILTTSDRWQSASDAQVLATDEAGEPYRFDFYFGNTGLIDVFKQEAKDWFWNVYQELTEYGVAGWWGDLGEPEVHPDDIVHVDGRGDEVHNAYGHVWAGLVADNWRKTYADRRLFLLMRAGFVGSQRYGMIPWTGDVLRGWRGLKPQPELTMQMGLMGLAYTHSDLGGFASFDWDPEAYTRWLQYGVFQPIYRPHGIEPVAPEIALQEPEIRERIRPFIELRYKLLPYLYTMSFENSQTGIPLMRPLFYVDESLMDVNDTYLWGDSLLVSPVAEAGITSKLVPLPAGTWFSFWDDTIYQGGQDANVPVTLDDIPVLVKAGAFIPMLNEVNVAANYHSDAMTIHYYHDNNVASSSSYVYEDDGATPHAFAKQQYEKLHFNAKAEQTNLQIQFSAERRLAPRTSWQKFSDWWQNIKLYDNGYEGMPAQRHISLVVHNAPKEPRMVTVDGRPVEQAYDAETRQLTLSFDWDHRPARAEIFW